MKSLTINGKKIALFALILLEVSNVQAQVRIGPSSGLIDGSVSLDIKSGPYSSGSPYRGLLPPTVTTMQRSQIQNPAKGLTIFNTTTNQIEVNTGTTTAPIWTPGGAIGTGGSSSAWSLTGNAGTTNSTNFIGTTDNIPLNFRVNNQNAGRIDPSQSNVALGFYALNSVSTGQENAALGTYSLRNNTSGNYNTALGARSLEANTYGYENTASGALALQHNISGLRNTAIGTAALENNTVGNYNTALGMGSLRNNTTGNENIALGSNAAGGNTTGYSNVAVGQDALVSNTDGHDNVALGGSALLNNITGGGNMASGNLALSANLTGQNNTAVGTIALRYNTTGDYNTAVGVNAGPLQTNPALNNSTAIGANAVASGSNEIVLGDNTITALRCNVQTISSLSDKRIKEDIQANVPGLSFITKLTPVTYHVNKLKEAKLVGYSLINVKEDKVLHSGFLAQDVEAAAKAVGYAFEGVHQQAGSGYYTLGYTLFVIPLVKAVKELNTEVEELKAKLNESTTAHNQLALQIKQIQEKLGVSQTQENIKIGK